MQGGGEPSISVVIPVRDGAASLPRLLASLAGQTLAGDDFEVIVCDNGSRDGSGELARAAGATVVVEPSPGRARARNAGAARARGRSLAFVDGDCVAEPGWLEALAGCLERSPLAAGRVRLTAGEPPNRYERFDLAWRFRLERQVGQGFAASANLGVRRDAFQAIGGFDTSYRGIGEDVDLCLRAGERGFSLAACPDAVVSHPAEAALGPVVRRAARHGYANAQLRRRFAGRFGVGEWRHPGPLLRAGASLRHLGIEEGAVAPDDRRSLRLLARADYAARMAGGLWAELALRRERGVS